MSSPDVFERNAVVLRDKLLVLAGPNPAAHICQSGSTADEDRLTERSLRVGND
ncbi:MAG TPA: hypothetical protein VET24_08550 [Actinomycetota bacterium]|nr:hypothetical protein [Actinomycetota bacterium]